MARILLSVMVITKNTKSTSYAFGAYQIREKGDMATLYIDACAQYYSIVTLQSNSEAECVWAIIEFMQSSANRCLQME